MSVVHMKVTCDHCGDKVPINEAHKTEWRDFDLHWYYCDFCENNVFGKIKTIFGKTGKGKSVQSILEVDSMNEKEKLAEWKKIDILKSEAGDRDMCPRCDEQVYFCDCCRVLADEIVADNYDKILDALSGDTVILKKPDFLDLIEDREFLECLQACGVDNWSGYGDAKAMMNEEEW